MTADPPICALCRRPTSDGIRAVVGVVCPTCWRAAYPESAPVWAEDAKATTPGQRRSARRLRDGRGALWPA